MSSLMELVAFTTLLDGMDWIDEYGKDYAPSLSTTPTESRSYISHRVGKASDEITLERRHVGNEDMNEGMPSKNTCTAGTMNEDAFQAGYVISASDEANVEEMDASDDGKGVSDDGGTQGTIFGDDGDTLADGEGSQGTTATVHSAETTPSKVTATIIEILAAIKECNELITWYNDNSVEHSKEEADVHKKELRCAKKSLFSQLEMCNNKNLVFL